MHTVTIITIIITERYVPKMCPNAITHPRESAAAAAAVATAGKSGRAVGAPAIRPIISFTFANCESRRRPAIRERIERGVATPSVLCISSIHVAVSGTDTRYGAPLCAEAIRKTAAQVHPLRRMMTDGHQTFPSPKPTIEDPMYSSFQRELQ